MAMRYFNWKLAIVLFVAAVVFAVAAVTLHRWQKSMRAEQALPRAQKAYEQKDWDEAAVQFGRYLTINSEDTEVLIKYANAQMNRRPTIAGNVQLAIAAYRAVLRLNPDDVETTRRLTSLYLRGELAGAGEAKLIAQRYLERRDDPILRRMLAQAMWFQREFEAAVTELTTVIEANPGEILAFEFMGLIFETRPEMAGDPVKWFNEAVAKNPESALAYAVRAAYYLRHNDKSQAMADLTHAATCDLSDTSVRLRVIAEYINAGEWEKAREQLRALQATSPSEPDLWNAWAELTTRADSREEMRTVAEEGMKALGLNAWDFMPVATRLLILSSSLVENAKGGYELSDQTTVNDYLSRMRNREIELPTVAYLEGLVAEKQGRLRDAIRYWQQAVSLPGVREQTFVAAYRSLASVFSRLGDNRLAISQLQILLSKRPQDTVGVQLALTRLYAQTRDWPKVLEEAQRILETVGGPRAVKLEAMLLGLRAQIYLLAGSGAATAKPQAWRDLEARVAELDKEANGILPVKLLQIQIAMAQKKLAEADAWLGELERENPSDLQLMLLRAELCVAQGKENEARTMLHSALAKFPQVLEPVRQLAILLDRRNQRQECESVIKEALARGQEPLNRRDLSLMLAEFYYRWQEKEKYYQWLTDLVAQYPNDIQPRSLLLTCDAVVQDVAKAQKVIDEIKRIEGENGSVWRYEQARWWVYASRFKDSHPELEFKLNYPQIVKLLRENLLANPEDQASRLLLGGVYEAGGEPQLALAIYREAFARFPNNTRVLWLLVNALHKAREFGEAQDILDKAGQRDLLNPDLQRLQVDNDIRHDNLDSAADTLQQLIKLDPNDNTLRLSYARVLILRNEFAQAEAILTDLRAKDPNSIGVAYAQIRLCLLQGDTDKAIQICNEMVDKLHSAAVCMLRADVHFSVKEYDKALQDLGQAVSLEPQNADTWGARARLYSSLGKVPDAIADVRRALALVSEDSPDQMLRIQKLAVRLFTASAKQSLWREAERILDRALAGQVNRQGKEDSELRLLKAEILVARSTGPAIEEARSLLKQVTSDDPKYLDAWKSYARIELEQDEPGRALDIATRGLAHGSQDKPDRDLLLLKAIAEKKLSPSVAALTTLPQLARDYPDDVGILIEWADAYARAERPEKAVELLSQKLAGFSGAAHRRCEIALAAALYSSRQEEKSRALFDALIAAEPNDPAPVIALAGLLRKQKRWTEVNQLVNLWRTTNPGDAETATSVARILAGGGDKEALQMAEDQLRMILGANPKSISTLVLLAMLMQDAGREEEATKLNRRILDLDPNNLIAINNLAWALCEQSSPAPAAIEEAIALANRGIEIMPDYMDLLDTRGVAYYRHGELGKAVEDFTKCIGLFPSNSALAAAPHFHLARTFADLHRKTEAVEHLKKALTLNGKNIQLAREHADAGRMTHAIKVLRDAITLQEQMDRFKMGFDSQDLVGIKGGDDWTEARLLLGQLQRG